MTTEWIIFWIVILILAVLTYLAYLDMKKARESYYRHEEDYRKKNF